MRHHMPVLLMAAVLAGCGQSLKDSFLNRTGTVKARSSLTSPFGVNNAVSHGQSANALCSSQVTLTAVAWDREILSWEQAQPEFEKDAFHWGQFDHVMRQAKACGLKVLPVLSRSPAWAARNITPIPGARAIQLPNLVQWERFAAAAVERYKNSAEFWEVWSRPDSLDSFDGTPADYADMLKATYAAIRRADPNSIVVMGSIANPEWFEKALVFGAGNHCDVISMSLTGPESADDEPVDVHLIERDKTPDGKAVVLVDTGVQPRALKLMTLKPFDEGEALATAKEQLDSFRKAMRKYGINKPIWVNAAGAYPAAVDDQARFTVKLYAMLMANRVDRVFWGEFLSERDGNIASGLLYPDLSRRPAADAYCTAALMLGQAKVSRVISDDPENVAVYEFKRFNSIITVAWAAGDFAMQLPAGYKQVFDMFGKARPLRPEEESSGEVMIGPEPIFITSRIPELKTPPAIRR